jgi:hypothetical protein
MADVKYLVFQGLPRESKTYTGLQVLSKANTGIYLSSRHEIIDQSFDRFQCPPNKTAVKMEGKSRLCTTGTMNCAMCPMKPEKGNSDHIDYFEQVRISESLLVNHPKLSKDDVKSAETKSIVSRYGGLCRYYTLEFAMKRSNYVFTVPQIRIPKEKVEILVIDEDTTFSYYFPQAAEICSYSHLPNHLSRDVYIPDFKFLKEEIELKPRKQAVERDILKAVGTLERWKQILISFKEGEITAEKVIEELNARSPPEFEGRDAAYKRISKILVADGRLVWFDPVFYPAPNRFYLETGRWSNTIFAIADSEHQIREFPKSDRVLTIGATLAEKIPKSLDPDGCKAVDFKSFRFARNLVIFPVKCSEEVTDGNITYTRTNRDKTQKFMLQIAKNLYQIDIPSIIVTGSEKFQRQAEKELRELDVSPEVCQQENIHEMMDNVLTARPTIIYANSSTSRGIDLDMFDVNLLYHAGFSTPYWSAMEAYWEKEKNPQRALFYHDIRERILTDETVNLAYRIAPVKGAWEEYPKILFVPEYYLGRLRSRCEDHGVEDAFDTATSSITLCPQDFDITNLGTILRAQIRYVVKKRDNLKKKAKSRSDPESDATKVSNISNRYPDLPKTAPILNAVRDGRLVETVDGFVLDKMKRSPPQPTYQEQMIHDLVVECIRTHRQTGGNGRERVPTMEIIGFVQNPPDEWISTHHKVAVLPDSRDIRGRPQKYLATREQIRSFLKHMESNGELTCFLKGRKLFWSLPEESASTEMTKTAIPVTEERAHA